MRSVFVLYLLVQLMNHFDEKAFIFVQIMLTFFNYSVWYLWVESLTTSNHLLKVSVVGKVGIVYHVRHESIPRVKASYFVVFLQYFAEATVCHDAKGFKEKQVSVEPINTFCQHAPKMESILSFHNVQTFYYPFFSNVELRYNPIKEVDSLLKFSMQQFEE